MSKTTVESLVGVSLFATHTTVLIGMFLYQMPKKRFPELLPGAVKRPSSKFPFLDTKVWFSLRGCDSEMVSVAAAMVLGLKTRR